VRRAIIELAPPTQRFASRADEPVRVLVLGGSQGAQILNQTVPAAYRKACREHAGAASQPPLIRHQAGAGARDARQAYADAGVAAEVDEFIEDMAAAYAWADSWLPVPGH
jgi:UDP-N-acetylglucosamine--N-acetylmuramyl-(pentapeptide) pyrophosphoryl-undecaprenol N-acetylglucosamine transferase